MLHRRLRHVLRRGLERYLGARGYVLVRAETQRPRTMTDALETIGRRQHVLNTVIDVGASNGSWSRAFMRHYPSSQYLLLEPQPVHAAALEQFMDEHRNVHCVTAAAGAAAGQIFFDASDPLGGQASYSASATHVTVPVTTIDEEVATRRLEGPFLIKLDTHGFEVPILKGATRTLAETDVIVMECYNFKIAPECLLFFEMCAYLREMGFRCIDLVDPMSRPDDQAFWQMDMVFVRDTRPEFRRPSYR